MIRIVFRTVAFAAFAVAITFGSPASNRALGQAQLQTTGQDRQQNSAQHRPGQFDFYVLALSWSPSFCAESEERGRNAGAQCSGRPYSFVVHGLWPQYERGFPRDCQIPAPRLNRDIMSSMLDLMPAPRLVYHEWDKHGTCTGLDARAYFDLVRKARSQIAIPEAYVGPKSTLSVTPDEVEDAFVKANPGLTRAAIAVTCGGTRLSEVRVCFSKDLRFRDCPEVDRRACLREKLTMPPIRGG
jgi:ribonuclease T2